MRRLSREKVHDAGGLTFCVPALAMPCRVLGPHRELAPLVIGFTVAVLISIYAPLTQVESGVV